MLLHTNFSIKNFRKNIKKTIEKHSRLTKIILILTTLTCFYSALNQNLSLTKYNIEDKLIPTSFDNYKIVHLTDLHSSKFGKKQSKLIKQIKELSPDLIVLTGDMIDNRELDYDNSNELFEGIKDIAPVYLVSGNHDAPYKIKTEMVKLYEKNNLTLLDDKCIKLYSPNSSDYIELCGVPYLNNKALSTYTLPDISEDKYTILLNHRTDSFDSFIDKKINLVLSGHTHGGIIRIPFGRGIIGNSGNFFPKYDCGKFTNDTTTMLSSKGLGTTRNIPRVFNRPEIVLITLHHKD